MSSCGTPGGCERVFDHRFAGRRAARYRKRGLDPVSRRIVELVAAVGASGATVLEIGGGTGEIQLELLRRGATRVTNLELSRAYEAQARQLLAEAGLAGRAERRIHDIAADPEAIEPADVVILNRVVCCYPDYRKLLTVAAGHARRQLVFSYPPRNAISRLVVGAQNLTLRLRGNEFRVFTHPPEELLAVLAQQGLAVARTRRSGAWTVVATRR